MLENHFLQVIIVGAGPAGLMLACELRLNGVEVVIIERRARGTIGESRAPGINARTMEIFSQRGLAEQFRAKGRALSAVLFSGLPMDPEAIDPGWPGALILPQHETERILAERAKELGVAIRWSTELVHLTQDHTGVELFVQTAGKVTTLRAQYVAGCDGGHSVVRRACGTRFDGDDPLSHWLVADVQLDSPPSESNSFGRNMRVGTYQVSRIEGDWYRVSLMKVVAPTDRNGPVTHEELRQAMIEGLGTDYGLREARWMSRFSDGFRQVEQYRYGRVFFVGDAAHTHAPIGGQGLNLGIQDALNLGWKLAAVIRHHSSEDLLNSYHAERHPIAEAVLQLARAQTVLIKPGRQTDALRDVVSKMLAAPETTRYLAGMLSGLALHYSWGEGLHPLVGRRMPNMQISTDRDALDIFSLMISGRPLLLQFSPKAHTSIPERFVSWVDCIDIRPSKGKEFFNWDLPVFGTVPAIDSAFVRPDGYVAWVSAPAGAASGTSLPDAIVKWLG